jgi:fructokinase
MSDGRIVVFGEVLFDHFPDGSRVLGGAPFNVAWHLQAFGLAPLLLSRVGNDPEGAEIRDAMRDWGMDLAGLQTDPDLPTGRVSVALVNGEPSFDIVHPAAFDAIEVPDDHGGPPALLYHGTVAARDRVSRRSLQNLRANGPGAVFIDVNLRAPWWRRETAVQWLDGAHWAKLSGDELKALGPGLQNGEQASADFRARHRLQGLVLTHGERGAEILEAGGARYRVEPETGNSVIDTVGAGDAFAAVMIVGLVREWPTDVALRRAQEFASAMCGRRGATVPEKGFYRAFTDAWDTIGAPAGRAPDFGEHQG